jgi:hypothetical protein
MGIERRGNRYYYYKKEREGGRVVSRYFGGGSLGLYSMMGELESDAREQRRYEKQWEREKAEKFEAELSEIEQGFQNLITAFLLVNGYRQTGSREWRRKRNGRK